MTEISELDASKVKWSGVLPLNSLVITTVLSPSTTVFEVTFTLEERSCPGSWSPSFRSSTLPLSLVRLTFHNSTQWKVLLSIHNQGPRFVSHGKVGSAKGD